MAKALNIYVLTGQSGSGKSTVLRTLEDHGYFCIDNMPVSLVEQALQELKPEEDQTPLRIALVMDMRDRNFLRAAPQLIHKLRQSGEPLRLLYLEAREEILLRRYSETRRKHPLDKNGLGLRAAIREESKLLAPLRELADDTLDTSGLSPHQLRARTLQKFLGSEIGSALKTSLLSFGFKYGLPMEADMVLDVRFLPNPYFTENLKECTGLEAAVEEFVLKSTEAQKFLTYLADFLSFLVPQYQKEGKNYLTVGIGCTGGKHRSVVMVQAVAKLLVAGGLKVEVQHRDLQEKAS